MRRRTPRWAGMTLFELLVAVMLLGAIAGVAALALRAPIRPESDEHWQRIENARRAALSSGRRVSLAVVFREGAVLVTALPDGSVIADSTMEVDRLTGRRARHAQREVAVVAM